MNERNITPSSSPCNIMNHGGRSVKSIELMQVAVNEFQKRIIVVAVDKSGCQIDRTLNRRILINIVVIVLITQSIHQSHLSPGAATNLIYPVMQ